MLTTDRGLRWSQVLGISQGEMAIEQALAEHAGQASKAAWGDLVSPGEAAALIGVTYGRFAQVSHGRDFPLPVARIGPARVWRRSDIRMYRDGGTKFKTRVENELQAKLMDSHEIRRRLGIGQKLLTGRLTDRRWHLIPEPAGRVGGSIYYWKRSDAERWFKQNEKFE